MILTEDILKLGFVLIDDDPNRTPHTRSFRSVDTYFMLKVHDLEKGKFGLLWFARKGLLIELGCYLRSDRLITRYYSTGRPYSSYYSPEVFTLEEVVDYLVNRKFQPAIVLMRNKKIENILE